jgi:hypothetical protein
MSYLASRFKRLVLPTWIFLLLFYSAIFIVSIPEFSDIINLKEAAKSFALYGFGYVWIIRIFLLIAIISPLFVNVIDNIKCIYTATLIVAMLLANEGLANSDYHSFGFVIKHAIEDIILPSLSYGAMFCIGYAFFKYTKKFMIFTAACFMIIFIVMAIIHYIENWRFIQTQDFKCPQRIYYISYAVAMTIISMLIAVSVFDEKNIPLPKSILFISSNSIWIYLWHIPIVEYFNRADLNLSVTYKYLIAYSVPVCIVWIQVYVVTICCNHIKNNVLKRNVRAIFTG